MGAKQARRCIIGQLEIKRIHVIAHRMMLGNIEGFEVVIRRLDFRAFDDGIAEREKDAFDFFDGLADQVTRADRTLDAGKREVNVI